LQRHEKNPDQLIQMKIEGIKHAGEPIEFQCEDLLEGYLEKVKLTFVKERVIKMNIMYYFSDFIGLLRIGLLGLTSIVLY